ncbi:MAG: non-canonical purine NTP pyrophosphatase, RdgB/HAM1 family [Elusimicrobia bacterium CG08_land_8_20_14_0_20_51_18]|nr:MAG: non-canonical purine NTP pyrophosphatase, RdgB/HAM1 family [Elusimicrobia bacterium CG08_land_8_20_14_0_20_51_18]
MTELVIATRNRNKIKEISSIIPPGLLVLKVSSDFEGIGEIGEDGQTLEENSLKKARITAKLTGRWAAADDTGLEVEFLGGAPGIYSARWAGEGCTYRDNNLKLLAALSGVPREKRKAVFRCVISVASPSGEARSAGGRIEGLISGELRGEGGFGYDPLFYVPEYGGTFAELPPEIKNGISHRALALKNVRKYLMNIARFNRLDEK